VSTRNIKFDRERLEFVTAPLPEELQQQLNAAIEPALSRVLAKWDVPLELVGLLSWERAFYEDDTSE
jgi:hypothetical protein